MDPVSILAVLFVFTVVVFIHELGHFLVARWCGISVEVFSIGFGKELVGFKDRHGTRWRISAIPLGGYVRFLGDANAASVADGEVLEELDAEQRQHAFAEQPAWARAAVVAAGPIANFLLAIVIFTLVLTFVGRDYLSARVDEVMPDSAAAEAGLMPGDLITAVDGAPIESFEDLQRWIMPNAGTELTVTVQRGEEAIDLSVTPKRGEFDDGLGGTVEAGQLGITRTGSADDIVNVKYPLPEAAVRATGDTWRLIGESLRFFGKLVIGQEDPKQLGGPITMAQVAAQAAKIGFDRLVQITAFISVSIGLINLFPIPLLDGGHLAFYAAEAIRGKPLSQRVQEVGFSLGFAAIAMLMVLVVWNDVSRWFL